MFVPLRQRYLGIMTSPAPGAVPFRNRGFYRQLAALGAKAGLAVYVFSPGGVDWSRNAVAGYAYDVSSGEWKNGRFPLPDLVYDRCFCSSRTEYLHYQRQARRLASVNGAIFLGKGLKGKWDVHRMLRREKELAPYLPKTLPYAGKPMLADWFARHDDAFLKPHGGSQGRGALHIRKDPVSGGYAVNGRDRYNRTVRHAAADFSELEQWLARLIGGRKYLVQRYLELTTPEGAAFDIRSLVQKDGRGSWQLTGMAARIGRPGSVTSNLHGGGDVAELTPFLTSQFGEAAALRLASKLERLSLLLPPALERHHGRLAELGLDFGIDRTGRIWILEANSKPGRSIFARLHDGKSRLSALANPIRYARHLLSTTWNGADQRIHAYEEAPFFPKGSTGGQS